MNEILSTEQNEVDVEDFYIDYGKLDPLQRKYVDKKVDRNMVICGTAGSGKSLIALHKAKQVSQLGSYAVVVYTKTLRRYFEDGMKSLGLHNVYHYNHWYMMKKKGEFSHVKYLIVDECQDFTEEEIRILRQSADICFFFGDTAQSIMKFKGPVQSVQKTALQIGETMLPLQNNYRLTIENGRLAQHIMPKEDIVDNCQRHGVKPRAIKADSFDKQLDRIISMISNQSLSSVGILMPFNTKETADGHCGRPQMSVEYVKDYFLRKGVACEYKYDANKDTDMDLDFHSTTPKIMTWWCAKGLQFKDVFLPSSDYMCKAGESEDKRSVVYVAATRPSERLYLVYTGQLDSDFFPSASSDIFQQEINVEDLFG